MSARRGGSTKPRSTIPIQATVAVADAVEAIRQGGIVVVLDDEDRENEADLVMAAQFTDAAKLSFYVQHTSGVICTPMTPGRLDELDLPPMVPANSEAHHTAFTISVDARTGVTTGISGPDRARTINVLADPSSRAEDLCRPGHIFPLRARAGGVLERAGHTEAAVDLARLAGALPVGVICELVSDDKVAMARGGEALAFARRHRLPLIRISDLTWHRWRNETLVQGFSEARIPTSRGAVICHAYRSRLGGEDHLALAMGSLVGAGDVPIFVHRECLLGDVFGSTGCRCRRRIDLAFTRMSEAGRGVLLYLRDTAGTAAPAWPNTGASFCRGATPVAPPEAALAFQILRDLGIRSVVVEPDDHGLLLALRGFGLEGRSLLPELAGCVPLFGECDLVS